jgi:hypothetical protein
MLSESLDSLYTQRLWKAEYLIRVSLRKLQQVESPNSQGWVTVRSYSMVATTLSLSGSSYPASSYSCLYLASPPSAHVQRRNNEDDSGGSTRRSHTIPPAYGPARANAPKTPLSSDELGEAHAYLRTWNYLMLGMIYLQDNPLPKEPLKSEHIKNWLLGHWARALGLRLSQPL